jgi:polyisoprenyl-phosphate glycosyltransferase
MSNLVSIIFPTFNEEQNIGELYNRVKAVTKQHREEFELIFVDDHSWDATPHIIKDLREQDKTVRIIRFARNCGSHAALAAGLTLCKGKCAIVLAADLQDPPELITRFMEEHKNGYQVIWGVRKRREGESVLTKFLSRTYYRLINFLTSVKMAPLGADVFCVDRVVIEAFKQMTEKHTSVFMTIAWLGFNQSSLDYVKVPRFAGKSKWTVSKKIKLFIDSILSFSDIPVRYMSFLGMLTAFLGFIYALIVLWTYLHGSPVQGWSSLMVVILVVSGVQMMMLGVLGEYLWRTFDESRKRPRYVIEYTLE